jgi:peptidyl-prolyl cis-trans isomerase A (cyclophilin A)
MRRYLSILLSSLLLLTASCEDTEKSSKKESKQELKQSEKVIDSVAKTREKATKNKKGKLLIQDEPDLVQEELIPYLMKYGKKHPENKIRIKTRFGDIDVLLYNDTPLHRANFLMLVNKGYFDGTFFHRVAKDFVIQGGNADNKETGVKRHNNGSYLIPSEFDAGYRHNRGAFSAAKYSEQNISKASSPYEFFIVQSDRGAHHLNNDHTVFGRVIKGMDVVDTIAQQPVGEGEWPMINIHMTVEILD